MRRFALLLVLFAASPTAAGDLPPGALVRLGDDRFRAGGAIHHLALSPDGKQFATTRLGETGVVVVTTWDAITGKPSHSHQVNTALFRGLVWGPGGARAIVTRADATRKNDELPTITLDDFRVWDFTDPKAEPQPVLQTLLSFHQGVVIQASRKQGVPEYTNFVFSGDGSRVAAKWKSTTGKHAVHVFELKPAPTVANLTQVGTLDFGAEGVDEVCISADGKTVVTFRVLSNTGEYAATIWDVSTGKPGKPVRVPLRGRLMLTPDGKGIVKLVTDTKEWGFDFFDLTTGKQRELTRWRYTAEQLDRGIEADCNAFAFTASGRELTVSVARKTYVIDVARGKELARLEGHASPITSVAISADGATIATADVNGLVRLWDGNTLRPFTEALGHRAEVRYAELSPEGKRVLTWAEDETIRLWDLATGKELRAFAGAVCAYGDNGRTEPSITFTPDGTAVLFCTKMRPTIRDLQTGLESPLPGEMAKLEGQKFAVFAPDGKAVLTWGENPDHLFDIEVWDWPSGTKRFAVADLRELKLPGFAPDSTAVFAEVTQPNRWDAKTGKVLPPVWKHEKGKYAPLLSLRPNPRWLLNDASEATLIEAGTGKRISRFRLASAETGESYLSGFWGTAVAPTGGQYAWAWGLGSEEVQVSESATWHVRRTLSGHRGEVRVLGFTPDGTKLLTAGGDHTVLVWDMRLAHVPLPEAIKKETSAAKLWNTLATGNAKDAYLAMARLAREPDAAVKMAKLKLKPAAKAEDETDATRLADARAIELLEALETDDSRTLLKELAAGPVDAFRTQEAKRALERQEKTK